MLHFPHSKLFKPLQSARQSNDTISSTPFDVLPLEITCQILEELDVGSLIAFKNTSWKTLVVLATSLPGFWNVVTHAPGALRALAATGLLSSFTARQISEPLYSHRCKICNDFGPYLFLPTCERSCWTCLNDDSRFQLIPKSRAYRYLDLTMEELQNLPMMIPISSKDNDTYRIFSNLEGPLKIFSLAVIRQKKELISCDNLAHKASTPFPFLDIQNEVVEHGVWCRGCEDDIERSTFEIFEEDYKDMDRSNPYHDPILNRANRAYRMEEFIEHAKHCKGARRIKLDASDKYMYPGGGDHRNLAALRY